VITRQTQSGRREALARIWQACFETRLRVMTALALRIALAAVRPTPYPTQIQRNFEDILAEAS
jgi:hypothetical protein